MLGCAAIVLTVLAATTSAQSWTHAPLIDKDSEAEQYSEFWEHVLHGFDGNFDELLAQAEELQNSRMASQRDSALPILERAARLKPKDPQVQYRIGRHYKAKRNWKQCALFYGKAFALDPGFTPKGAGGDALGKNLGICLLYSEEFEGAVKHFRRLITQEFESAETQLRFGEALMALGRLDEAIFSLQRARTLAQNRSRDLLRETEFTLAVALDRAERLGESRSLLSRLTSRDSSLTTLHSSDKIYAPPTEELYYLGLAYKAQGNLPWALYSFRRFLSLAPKSPWASHAKSHLRRTAKPELAAKLHVSGSAQWSLAPLRAAIQESEGSLAACVTGYPQVLATITLSGALTRPSTKHQARAAISAKADVERTSLNKIVECLESAARKIRMPKQSGLIGGHGTAQFMILGTPND